MMHYKSKISELEFSLGSMAGFFQKGLRAPVVKVIESSLPPDWEICDMYYDLHCMARPQNPVKPGEILIFKHRLYYLSINQSNEQLSQSRLMSVKADDYKSHQYPRLALGRNSFERGVTIDGYDDASGFRQHPPSRVWDRQTGNRAKGSLRLTNSDKTQLIWTAEPPSLIPPNTRLNLKALVKTNNVTGKGIYLQARFHKFVWEPNPGFIRPATLTSIPISGTMDTWIDVTLPEFISNIEDLDMMVYIDVILYGSGTAWLTYMDVDLKTTDIYQEEPIPPDFTKDPVIL